MVNIHRIEYKITASTRQKTITIYPEINVHLYGPNSSDYLWNSLSIWFYPLLLLFMPIQCSNSLLVLLHLDVVKNALKVKNFK
jgi:hypothetical protein